MTLSALVRGKSTLDQYDIFTRADLIFAGSRQGRYYGGPLTDAEVHFLTPPKETRHEKTPVGSSRPQ